MKSIRQLLAALMLAACAIVPNVHAHGGDDHAEEAGSASAHVLAPRAEAKTDEVELLAVYDNRELTVYLSRYATNEPIVNAQLDIESGSRKAIAKPVADGVYKAAAPWMAKPGKYPLIATVRAKDVSDMLETAIVIHDDDHDTKTGSRYFASPAMIGGVGGIVAAGVIGAFFVRRKRKGVPQ